MPATKTKKILVHTCCAACASYVCADLLKNNYEPTLFYYNPQIEPEMEYQKRLADLNSFCDEKAVALSIADYENDMFRKPLEPYLDKKSIKYITDVDRYRRRRCNFCISLVLEKTADFAKKEKFRAFTTTLLCSPFKNHNEIWDIGLEISENRKIEFEYKDYRKGYWSGRNYARSHAIINPSYCGCLDSQKEGRLE